MAITADEAGGATTTRARVLPDWAPFAAWALVLALMIGVSAAATGEGFVYGLDDPLIHLAVAESILKGGYGVNFPELSAPSSSILFPWMLAGLLAVGAGVWAPLILTLGASVASLALWRMILIRAGLSTQAAGWSALALMLRELLGTAFLYEPVQTVPPQLRAVVKATRATMSNAVLGAKLSKNSLG